MILAILDTSKLHKVTNIQQILLSVVFPLLKVIKINLSSLQTCAVFTTVLLISLPYIPPHFSHIKQWGKKKKKKITLDVDEYYTYISRLEVICNFLESVKTPEKGSQAWLYAVFPRCFSYQVTLRTWKRALWKGLFPVHMAGGSSDNQERSGWLDNSPQLLFRQTLCNTSPKFKVICLAEIKQGILHPEASCLQIFYIQELDIKDIKNPVLQTPRLSIITGHHTHKY